jgi:hypothetical protein
MLASLTRASLVDAGTDQGNNNARRRSLYQWSPKDWEEKQKDLEDIQLRSKRTYLDPAMEKQEANELQIPLTE